MVMSVVDRVESLKAKHAALEAAIESESRRTYPDSSAIKEFKLKKLAIKDELERIAKH
jgi:hypothetical protein